MSEVGYGKRATADGRIWKKKERILRRSGRRSLISTPAGMREDRLRPAGKLPSRNLK